MNARVNVSSYKKLENTWAKALRNNQEVIVNIKPKYLDDLKRPESFIIKYTIDGIKDKITIKNIYGGK